jgi:hypothetical protein
MAGVEYLFLSTYFNQGSKRLKLFSEAKLMDRLLNISLKGGLKYLGENCLQLADYFDCHTLVYDGNLPGKSCNSSW